MKLRRQELILELVEREVLRSQEELRARLRRRGVEATQATISRDIRDLKLVKRAADGAYQRMNGQPGHSAAGLGAVERLAAEFLRDVDCVQQLVVLRTGAGQAQPLALAIDRAQLPEAVGTIAGDDTILLIARDVRRAASLAKRLKRLAAGAPQGPESPGRYR
jgi:transcriptional regulator of arginine metabolism